jgi:hypothetical protein
MFEIFNNIWVLIFGLFLLYAIYKKIKNLNKPFDELKFIEQFKNQKRLKKKINFTNLQKGLPTIASYYVGIN